MTTPDQPIIWRIREVSQQLGLSESTIYDKINRRSPRHDPSFPRPIQLGASAVGWLAHEVFDWLLARAAERDTPADSPPATRRRQRAKHARAAVTPVQPAKPTPSAKPGAAR
ncbi:helix-turn-helix transcriptional regulator [Crenobacter caeni]|uniref:AlpA family phage regulatory protein n=1 Tax=Crenobacter caeni TaxID=2705474 RepID=A0A6B2KTS7_9NEIS|nr:AlpA family phage regulatory protein [Crenobacter caeni]NDV13541.1 AlpA family phage regulatory protein [Crenobacter caeni]